MRRNLPITGREHRLASDATLVSVTDLKGRIVYGNAAFVAASGYALDELLGQPHSIVRHPDMPAEGFRDLWATIESGRPWTALVKNRRKNGDHYWVVANATPMRSGERIVGYLSVRSVPPREQVAAAEALYARMRAEEQAGRLTLRLRHGRLVRLDPAGRLRDALRASASGIGPEGAVAVAACGLVAAAASVLPAWAAAIVALGTATVAGWQIRRTIESRFLVLRGAALRLAAGDLTVEVPGGAAGVLGDLQLAIRQMAVNLRAAVHDVRAEVLSVRGAAGEIASGNQDLSSRTEAQSASLEQTAVSMEQINALAAGTASSVDLGAQLAASTADMTRRAGDAVAELVQAMAAIGESSGRIGEIVQTIEGIAFQTNILALNAAVEAARAGDGGRGFAVVAAEVRALAQRSGDAARQIRHLVADSTERVSCGQRQTDRADERMREATLAMTRLTTVLGEIGAAARQQQAGVARVSRSVVQLDGITQQNAAMVEQLAAAAAEVNHQVQSVVDSMALFRLRDGEASVAETDAVALRRLARAARAGPAAQGSSSAPAVATGAEPAGPGGHRGRAGHSATPQLEPTSEA